MILVIGFVIFLIIIIIKSILIFKYDTFENDGKYGDCRIKPLYDEEEDIPLSVAVEDLKIVEFKTLKQ